MIIRPFWLDSMPDGPAKTAAENRFFLRLAALYASESGTIVELSELIGVNYNALKSQFISKVFASRRTKDGIRRILGNDFVPPDIRKTTRSNVLDL